MSLLKKLLVAVTAMGVLGVARAEMVAQFPNLHTRALTDSGSYFAGDSNRYSLADIVNLPAGAEQGLVTGDATSMRPAAANATGSLLGAVSTLNGAIGDVSAVVDPVGFSESRSGTAGWHTGAGFLFSISEIPEPGDWMTLLSGLVVVAFMARRRNGPFAD